MEAEAQCLKTCLSLMRVCRLWRLVAAEFLYEDVRIADSQGLESLARGLQRSSVEYGSYGFGRYVRRLELPRRRTTFTEYTHSLPFSMPPIMTAPSPIRLVDIFRYCPRLEILVRPCIRLDAQDISFWGSLVSAPLDGTYAVLPCLKQLEWHETDLDIRFYDTKCASRLSEIITHAPNLQYLYLSSDRPDVLARLPPCGSLRTLRLNRTNFHAHRVKSITRMVVPHAPNLTHLILHSTLPSSLLAFVACVGPQLRVLEFAFGPQLVFSSNQMQRILSRCPALEELVYYLGAPEISPLAAFQHTALKRVRLKVSPDEWHPYKHVLLSQFEVLEGPSFPALQQVVLHDTTRSFVRRDTGTALLRRMLRRGCSVVYEDGSRVPLYL
ncbi:hypothetical protein B0H10DRAFT_1952328 [Mycena sp. CBHHK59/15]|nr:hypothetical protein B0H10DRAFT_1952328 [Mycena sp. CBHHK59/15]